MIFGSLIPSIMRFSFDRPIFGLGVCTFNAIFLFVLVDVRVLLMFAFSLDRFASVFAPFLYPRHNLTFIIFASILAWLIPIAFQLIGIPQILDCYAYSKAFHSCFLSISCSSNCSIFVTLYVSIVIFPAMFSSVVFTLALYIKGKKIRQQTSQMMGTPESQMTERDWKAMKTFLLLILTLVAVQIGILIFSVFN